MAAPHQLGSTPLTFELPRSLVDRIHRCRGRLGFKSVSDVVRFALARYDFTAFRAPLRDQLQVSVRLPPAQKRELVRHARRTKASAGELLRAALEALSTRLGNDGVARRRRPAPKASAKARTGRGR
jgi:Arc/MetJ-type ribon-helix-helix transcriptional regulator